MAPGINVDEFREDFIPVDRLNENERKKLIAFFEGQDILWNVRVKSSKQQKETALQELEEHFEFKYTSAELMAVWKSLRTSMLREIKRSKTENGYKSAWKFWNLMGFIKPALEKSYQKAEDWNDDEKRTLINFYSQHPSLWNHRLIVFNVF